MPIYCVYKIATGALLSTTRDQNAVARQGTLDVLGAAVAIRPDSEAGGVWDPVLLRFVPPPPPKKIPVVAFWQILTQDERIAFLAQAETDPRVKDWIRLIDLSDSLALDDPNSSNLLALMTDRQVISDARYSEITQQIANAIAAL
ncbi:hypothetical protein [Paracraurococcus ruber]|uniref:Uncharacterized protein n=1 Tax=Paracraurococcus ruber TaxID=77675 RepID=A0ABS1CQW9_9PROT|nr:hypothetical protein [Paracraurococcus ruber]MBK1656834.1 hypothetical protein [Paracraurococcus ruber]TDG33949.1 hypothetical protein E2C05_01530 [Paracraurococcus ruber]